MHRHLINWQPAMASRWGGAEWSVKFYSRAVSIDEVRFEFEIRRSRKLILLSECLLDGSVCLFLEKTYKGDWGA